MTAAPTAPDVGDKVVMAGVGSTVKATALLETPPAAVTTTFPVVAPAGTVAVTLLLLHTVALAVTPLNVTAPFPCDDPKLLPAIRTEEPTAPEAGFRLLTLGAGVTVNVTALLALPLTVTITLPVVAPAGTDTWSELSLQLAGVAAVPLKVTELVPCVAPNPLPAIVTDVPIAPEFGERLVMPGTARATGDSSKTTKASRV